MSYSTIKIRSRQSCARISLGYKRAPYELRYRSFANEENMQDDIRTLEALVGDRSEIQSRETLNLVRM